MYTLLPYMFGAFYTGFVMRNAGWPMFFYALFQFCLWLPLLPMGMVSYFEATVYYTITVALHAIVGWTMAWALSTPPIVMGLPAPTSTCSEHAMMVNTVSRAEKSKKGSLSSKAVYGWGPYLYRLVGVVVTLALFLVATLPYEYIDMVPWVGAILTFIVVVLFHIVFWLIFTKRLVPQPFKTKQAVFIDMAGTKCRFCGDDMTHDIVFYLAIYFATTTITYCVVMGFFPSWSFYTSIIIAGALEGFYLLMGLTWLRMGDKRAHAKKVEENN